MVEIICAVDIADLEQAKILTKKFKDTCMIKLGLEFFVAQGFEGVKAIADLGADIFLDLKLHDIPNTVKKTLKLIKERIKDCNIKMTTIHIAGGEEMMKASVEIIENELLLIGVTKLTSLDSRDEISGDLNPIEMAAHGYKWKLSGIVCACDDITIIKDTTNSEFLTVVPGIRPKGAITHDQKRTATPEEAEENGADYIVMGRGLTHQY